MILANHGIVSSSGSSFDADALAFITAASITDNTQKTAINTLVTDLKTYNIWSKTKAIYPFVGGSATSHKYNLKDPRDVDAAYRLEFFGGWTHSSTGALPNGTNAYADTKLKPTDMAQNSAHMSVYLRTNIAGGVDMGCNGINRFWMTANENIGIRPLGLINVEPFVVSGSQLDTRAFLLTSRTNSTTNKLYRNSSQIYNETAASSTPITLNIYLGARHDYGVPGWYSARQQAFASIGDGLSDTEASNFYTAVQNFNTTLNRQV